MLKLALAPLVIDEIDPALRDSVQMNLQRIQDYVNLMTEGLNPTGSIIGLASTTPPPGYLLADGSVFSASSYPDLNTYLGGTTLPDYRGKFLVGKDGTAEFLNVGQTGGAKTVTVGSGNLPLHTHAIDHDHPAVNSGGGSSHDHGLTQHNHGGGTGVHSHTVSGGVFGTSNTAHTHYFGGGPGEGSGAPQGAGRAGSAADLSTVGVANTLQGSADTTHNHSVDVANLTGSSGNGGFANTALDKLPPYRVLNWFIKT